MSKKDKNKDAETQHVEETSTAPAEAEEQRKTILSDPRTRSSQQLAVSLIARFRAPL